MFLTKNPRRYAELQEKHILPEGDNFWWGTSVTTNDDLERIGQLPLAVGHRFISIEPLIEAVDLDLRPNHTAIPFADWVIIGAMTGTNARKYRPQAEWVLDIVHYCDRFSVPVFLKDSLAAHKEWSFETTPSLRAIPQSQLDHIRKVKPVDWKAMKANKVRVESVRDKKTCRQCGRDIQGKPARRFSARYYICDDCYEGGCQSHE
jgi:hypothetical protein